MGKTKEQAVEDLRGLATTVVDLLKNNNVGIGVTKDKKFVLIDSETGICMELDE